MICSIYKSIKKLGSYLYLPNKDDFSMVPESLLNIMGKLEFVMILDIKPSTSLAQADVKEVLNELQSNGFYLQLADPKFPFYTQTK
ncbi:MAG: YcgL domain-containing protein [Pseudomonadota bacterium]